MSIVARECTLQDLLSNRRHYKVAPYQRKYEWTLRHLDTLLNDLQYSFERTRTDQPSDYHFVGSFIFQKSTGKQFIVDGQQRLTSISIILAVARDLTADDALRRELHSHIVDNARLGAGNPVKRIEHHRGDEAFFDLYVVAEGATSYLPDALPHDEQAQRIVQHVRRARSALADLNSNGNLREFVSHLVQQCKAIEITIDKTDDPFRIFTCVNGRGQPVRQQDVLRVTLVDAATEDRRAGDALLKKWDKCEQQLGADHFERYLVLRQSVAVGASALPDRNLTAPFPEFKESEELRAFLSDGLKTECEAYLAIVTCDVRWRHNRKLYPLDQALYSLSLITFDDWRPLAVRILSRYERDAAQALIWLRKLEALAWYWFLDSGGKYDERDRLQRFHSIDKYLRNHATWELDRSAIELIQKEKRELLEFLRGPLEPDLPELRPLLLRLEQLLRRGSPAYNLRGGEFTIEHVVPKSGGGSEWRTYLNFASDAEVRALSLYIGNHCFVTRTLNREMGEQLFDAKKELATSARTGRDSFLSRDLCTAKRWDQTLVANRTEKFVQLLGSEWGIV